MDRKIEIMGILNLTEDSYYSQSRCHDVQSAMERMERMLDEGADIIDIGACSTRPGSCPVGPEEEWKRLEPVLRTIRNNLPAARISIDTYWSEIVGRTFDLIGDFIVNDISSGEDDPQMLPLVGRLGLTYVAMHKRGDSMTMQSMCDYHDVTAQVVSYFEHFALRAQEYGIKHWILDPGFGFAKDTEQNYRLLRELDSFRRPFGNGQKPPRILVGVSRKSMIYKYLNITPEEALSATQVLHVKALQNGADILRVHDVAEALRTVKLYEVLQ